jgi:subtilisin
MSDWKSSVLKYVKPERRAFYEEEMEIQSALRTYNSMKSDITLDEIEALRFDPSDVDVDERNWTIDFVGDSDQYDKIFDQAIAGRKVEFIIMDTGVPDHKDFGNANKGGLYYPNENWPDRNGHATAIGSYVASTNKDTCLLWKWCEGNDPIVSAYYVGVLSTRGSGSFQLIAQRCRAMVERVRTNTRNGVLSIVNLSLGASTSTPTDLGAALDSLRAAGAVIVGASGNESISRVGSPANHRSVLATSAFDPDGSLASYSNWGTGIFHAAGGTHIFSAAPGNRYVTISGTSMATPISGTILAMIWLTRPDVSTAEDVILFTQKSYNDAGQSGYDTRFGNGYGTIQGILDVPVEDDDQDDDSDQGGDDPVVVPPREVDNRSVTTVSRPDLLFKWKTSSGKYSGELTLSSVSFRGFSKSTYTELGEQINEALAPLEELELTIPDDKGEDYATRMLGLLIHKGLPKMTLTEMRVSFGDGEFVLTKNFPRWMMSFYKTVIEGSSTKFTKLTGRRHQFVFSVKYKD